MNQKHCYALVFDMDGVIVDNHQWHFRAWLEFCRQHGFRLSEEEFYTTIFGGTNRDLLTRLYGNTLTDAEILQMGEEKELLYRTLYEPHIKPVPGVREFILSARERGIRTALATSAPMANVTYTLKHTGLENNFDVIVESSQIAHGKPHPEIYIRVASLLGLRTELCAVFEDSLPGIQSAREAGCKVTGVATTLQASEISHADLVISDFTDQQTLFAVIDSWFVNRM